MGGRKKFCNPKRVVKPSKYERLNTDVKEWWLQLFKKAEDEIFTPPYTKYKVRQEVLSDLILGFIEDILLFPSEKSLVNTSESFFSINKVLEKKKKEGFTSYLKSLNEENQIGEKKIPCVEKEKEVEDCDVKEIVEDVPIYGNPYKKFFTKSEHEVKIWRPKVDLESTKKNLQSRAEYKTETIVNKFYAWLNEMGCESPDLTPKAIHKLFKIGFDLHASRSLQVCVRELNAVTPSIAKARQVPSVSRLDVLRRYLLSDVKAERKPERMVAFNKCLPIERRSKPVHNDTYKKWIDKSHMPLELATMQPVWDGLLKLRSTQGYCNWLKQNPERNRPPFLEENDMFESSSNMKFSIDDNLFQNQ